MTDVIEHLTQAPPGQPQPAQQDEQPRPDEQPQPTLRDEIVATADDLFYRRGVQSVGMDELRSEAGISLKRLYRELPSKDAIVLAVLERRAHAWRACLSREVDAASTPREKLLAVYDYLIAWTSDEDFHGCGFINMFGELGSINPEVAEAVRAHKEGFAADVAHLAADLGLAADVAPQLVLLAEGAQTMAAILPDGAWAATARAAATTLIEAGLAQGV